MKTVSMLRIIFDDMIDRGMPSIPAKLSENIVLESNISDLLPTIVQYTTLKNHKVIIKYIGSYSSWDDTN